MKWTYGISILEKKVEVQHLALVIGIVKWHPYGVFAEDVKCATADIHLYASSMVLMVGTEFSKPKMPNCLLYVWRNLSTEVNYERMCVRTKITT